MQFRSAQLKTMFAPLKWVLVFAAVLALAAFLFTYQLGQAPICGLNEAVEGLAVQRIVERGKLLFPVEQGAQPMYKPPLFHWTAAALDKLFGYQHVTEFNLRLTSAVYAIAGIALTMAFTTHKLGPQWGALSGLVLLASYQYVSQARYGRVDMTLTFFETLALFLFVWTLPSPFLSQQADSGKHEENDSTTSRFFRTAARWLLGGALGCAVLAKGPVGAFLPLLAIALWTLVGKRSRLVLATVTVGPVALFAVVALSWYAACFLGRRYGVLNLQLGAENFGRFFGTLGRMPSNYYLVPLLLNSGPLSVLAAIAAVASLKSDPGAKVSDNDRAARGLETDEIAQLLSLFWFATVVFFSLAAYKRKAYLLPLWPTNAFLICRWLQAQTREPWGSWITRALTFMCALLVGFNFFFVPRHELHKCADSMSFKPAAKLINRVVGHTSPLFIKLNRGAPVLAFYLDRPVIELTEPLAQAPEGYVVTSSNIWHEEVVAARASRPDVGFRQMMTIPGTPPLVLLRRESNGAKGF